MASLDRMRASRSRGRPRRSRGAGAGPPACGPVAG
jgi:hypothetical protein